MFTSGYVNTETVLHFFNTESESEMSSEIRPNRGSLKIRKLFHMTSRKQNVQGECIMNEQQPNSRGHEDSLGMTEP